VKDRDDLHALAQPVDNDVRGAAHDQFARRVVSADPAQLGVVRQRRDCLNDAADNLLGRTRIVERDVRADVVEILEGRFGPDQFIYSG
jgi:hypothetical protein